MDKKCWFFVALITLLIFSFFAHTLNYPWRYFDEDVIFNETLLPIPNSFFEFKEIIASFGVDHLFESSNPIYSNISNMRGNPIWLVTTLFIFYLLKSSALNYHLFMLILHVFNAIALFLILRLLINNEKQKNKYLILIFLLTLIWAFHPVNIESVLFATNFGILITYFLCLTILYYYISKTQRGMLIIHNHTSFRGAKGDEESPSETRNEIPRRCFAPHRNDVTRKNFSVPIQLVIFITYFFALAMHEYAFILPIIIFIYQVQHHTFHNNSSLKAAYKLSLKNITPLLFGLIIFSIYFLTSPVTRAFQGSSLIITLERIFWFAPQIFFHYLKLIFFPNKLSVDHASLVDLSKTLINPQSIMCFIIFMTFIILFLQGFIKSKNAKLHLFFISFCLFFIALVPYLHIITPIYNIASERYLYFPLLMLTFGIANLILFWLKENNSVPTQIIILLAVILLLFSNKSYARTLDWKDSKTLLASAINTTKNGTYKGLRQHMLANSIKEFDENYSKETIYDINKKALKYLKHSLKTLKHETAIYQNKVPEVIKYYGLDSKTMEAKTAYLIALIGYEFYNGPRKASNFVSKYLDSLRIMDSQILNFYYRVLFLSGQIDKAENLINKYLKQNKVSYIALVAYSDLLEYKFNNLDLVEKYLLESFKLFPYDISTLFGLKRLYRMKNDLNNFARFSYLYALRTHDLQSFKEATHAYLALNKTQKARNIIKLVAKSYTMDEEFKRIQTAINS